MIGPYTDACNRNDKDNDVIWSQTFTFESVVEPKKQRKKKKPFERRDTDDEDIFYIRWKKNHPGWNGPL